MAQSKRYTGSRSIHTTVNVYGSMDVDDNMMFTEHLICCGVEREEIYMGGGLMVYKCHTCGSKMEVRK
jgi:hypothetical protein